MNDNVKKFVEEYNKRMSWNRDIIKKFKIKYNKLNEYLQKFIDENLTTEDITEEGIDLEHAKVFEYGPEDSWCGTLEMQAFNNKTYDDTYFWVKPISEEKYKKDKINLIIKLLDDDINKRAVKINELNSLQDSVYDLRLNFNRYE